MMLLIKSAAVWPSFVLLAILNGGLREKVLIPYMGPHVAEPLSVVLLSLLIFLVTWALVPFLAMTNSSQAWQVGFLWLVLTILFEFLFGHFVVGDSWRALLEAYQFWKGELWIVVLMTVLCSPYLAAKVRGMI